MTQSKPTVRALVVEPDGTGRVIDVPDTLDGMRAAIGGGYLEAHDLRGGVHLYCDEDGNRKALPVNNAATLLARALGARFVDWLRGPVMFLAHTPGGDEADVPGAVLRLWEASWS